MFWPKQSRHHAITHATLPPAVLTGLPEEASLDSMGVLIVAGDMLPGSQAQRWSLGRQLINAYGPTETTVCATMHTCHSEQSGNPSDRPTDREYADIHTGPAMGSRFRSE